MFRRILDHATENSVGGVPPVESLQILSRLLGKSFEAVATGGYFGATKVLHFNGGLFADNHPSPPRGEGGMVGGMLSRRTAGEHVATDATEHGDPAAAVTPCHPEGAIGTVKYPRLVPKDEECAKLLKKRTLTNLYNERPTWLDLAHKKLDAAVFAAYDWDPAITDDELLAALLALNLQRATAE